jgi:hypothetical protein
MATEHPLRARTTHPGTEDHTMKESKRVMRDLEDDAKETWRRADGDESLGDKIANTGDRLRHGVENVGDELHEGVDDAARKLEYERGRADEALDEEKADRR